MSPINRAVRANIEPASIFVPIFGVCFAAILKRLGGLFSDGPVGRSALGYSLHHQGSRPFCLFPRFDATYLSRFLVGGTRFLPCTKTRRYCAVMDAALDTIPSPTCRQALREGRKESPRKIGKKPHSNKTFIQLENREIMNDKLTGSNSGERIASDRMLGPLPSSLSPVFLADR